MRLVSLPQKRSYQEVLNGEDRLNNYLGGFVLQDHSFSSHPREKLACILPCWIKSHTQIQQDCIREGFKWKSRQINTQKLLSRSNPQFIFKSNARLLPNVNTKSVPAFLAKSYYSKCNSFLPKTHTVTRMKSWLISTMKHLGEKWSSIPARDYCSKRKLRLLRKNSIAQPVFLLPSLPSRVVLKSLQSYSGDYITSNSLFSKAIIKPLGC